MQITLELPDDVGLQAQVKDLPRALVNGFALEGYRSSTRARLNGPGRTRLIPARKG